MNSVIQAIGAQATLRDGTQSNGGGNASPQEFIAQAQNARRYGITKMQIAGGQLLGAAARNGYMPRDYHKPIGDHYRDAGIETSALYRSICAVSLRPQSLSVHRETMRLLAEDGAVKVLQNFHGMNDSRLMGFAPQLAAEFGMKVMAGVCVEYKDGMTKADMEKFYDAACFDLEKMLEQGHQGAYFKNANGKMGGYRDQGAIKEQFAYGLISAVRKRFGNDLPIGWHTHDTYGQAVQSSIAVIYANEGKGPLTVDVLTDPMGAGTGQASLGLLLHTMQNSGDDFLIQSMPKGLNMEAINADMHMQYLVRGIYSGNEMKYNADSIERGFKAEAAGGSIGVLKGMAGVRGLLERVLQRDDWETQRNALYDIAPEVNKLLGKPTHVTPYQSINDLASAQAVQARAMGNDIRDGMLLLPDVRQYSIGALGRVSPDIDPMLQHRALVQEGKMPALTKEQESLPESEKIEFLRAKNQEYVVVPLTAEEMPDGMEAARTFLAKQTYKDVNGSEVFLDEPTTDEALVYALIGMGWKNDCPARKLITDHRNGVAPKQSPELPFDLREGGALGGVAPIIFGICYRSLDIQKLKDGFFQGIPDIDGRVQQLQAEIKEQKEELVSLLKSTGLHKAAVGRLMLRVNKELEAFEDKIGVSPSYSSKFDLGFKVVSKSDLMAVFEKSLSAATSGVMSQDKNELTKALDRVASDIEGSGFLFMQKNACVELFNKMLAESVQNEAVSGGVKAPSKLPTLRISDSVISYTIANDSSDDSDMQLTPV